MSMLSRVLETLQSYNDRQTREKDAREAARKAAIEMERRRVASGKPTGIACPACQSEMGEGNSTVYSGSYSTAPKWQEQVSNQQVLCPQCGYVGWRVGYSHAPDQEDKP